ncbi:pentatricopeptide repeat-containing protein At4g21065-like [Macadamia integrifolia]|uniref:pentatricopeptide repeat-containing protein At4g21065-like n=1 Tax=Macadamia integrifolia TaxID=60698 RepID=UPI001C4FE860|nr:pentatricopeptide repeat-containing protein At4g21065-like [Macadamia integrifolia]
MLWPLRPKGHLTDLLLRNCVSYTNHFSTSVTATAVSGAVRVQHKIDWVSQNKLFQKFPRLHSLEEECKSLEQLKQVLSYIFVSGLHRNPFVMSRVLYSCVFLLDENIELKRSYGAVVFSQMDRPNTFSWNTIIRAFAISSDSRYTLIAFQYYVQMIRQGVVPDQYTYPFLLQACGSASDLGLGKQVHCHVVLLGLVHNLFVKNALLHLYLVCGSMAHSWQLFDQMNERDVVSWTTFISGLVTHGFCIESLLVFSRMMATALDARPNVATMVSVMSACANLGSVDHTRCLHSYLEKAGWIEVEVSVRNALLDAYAKCGSMDCATQVFREMHGIQKDLYSWTTMIAGLAMHGHGIDAINLFLQMKQEGGIIPDAITFVAVLSACAHAGLVNEGLQIFESMEEEFGIVPEQKHYGCMVDLLGRAGLLQYAYEFVDRLPIEPNLAILGSLLSACRIHNNLELAETVLKKIESSCEYGGGAHVLLSNVYANDNRWFEVVDVRKGMRGREEHVKGKPPGRSWIQVKGVVHEFVVGCKFHPQAVELFMVLDGLSKLLV